jgi:hypothetical protein
VSKLGCLRWGGIDVRNEGWSAKSAQLLSAHATLSVADDVRDQAERQAKNARQADANTAELTAKHAYLTRLRELFLCDSATAMLWWADGDRDRMLRLAEYEKQFGVMVSLVAGTPNDTARPDKIAPLVARFLTDLDGNDRRYLIGQLAEIFKNYRRSDLAEELRKSESSDTSQDELHTRRRS